MVLTQDDSKRNPGAKGAAAVMQSTDSLVGHLVDVRGDHFIATVISKGGEFVAERMIGMHKVRIGQVGSYMKVRQFGAETVVMVERMWQEKDSEGRTKHYLRLSPLGELNTQGDFQRGMVHYPTTGAEVHALSTLALERIF